LTHDVTGIARENGHALHLSTLTLTPEELRRLREPVPDLYTNQFDTIDAAVNGCAVIVGANAHQYAPSRGVSSSWAPGR
jgi:hypothetical protein